MTTPTRIQIKIVSTDGTSVNGPSFDLPDPEVAAAEQARKQAEIESWRQLVRTDITAAMRLLVEMIRRCSPDIRKMLKALHDEGRSTAAFAALAGLKNFSCKAQTAFLSIWIECGHHIRREVADDTVLLDALRRLLPAYDGPMVRLYRGEPWKDFSVQRHGISWSGDQQAATIYARGLNAMPGGGGVLIETIAPTDAIISQAATIGVCGWEFEYVVDRRRLAEINVLDKFPQV
jgi:hypothetical protein